MWTNSLKSFSCNDFDSYKLLSFDPKKKKITQGLKSQQSIILRFDYQIHQEEEELIISVYMYNIFFTSLVEEDIDFNQSLFW